MGLVAPRHVGSSQTRARTRVPCIGRRILNHCATREAPTNVLISRPNYKVFPSVLRFPPTKAAFWKTSQILSHLAQNPLWFPLPSPHSGPETPPPLDLAVGHFSGTQFSGLTAHRPLTPSQPSQPPGALRALNSLPGQSLFLSVPLWCSYAPHLARVASAQGSLICATSLIILYVTHPHSPHTSLHFISVHSPQHHPASRWFLIYWFGYCQSPRVISVTGLPALTCLAQWWAPITLKSGQHGTQYSLNTYLLNK